MGPIAVAAALRTIFPMSSRTRRHLAAVVAAAAFTGAATRLPIPGGTAAAAAATLAGLVALTVSGYRTAVAAVEDWTGVEVLSHRARKRRDRQQP